jgi:hypothetical protein
MGVVLELMFVCIGKEFAESMIESIDDVTERAEKMREVLGKNPIDEGKGDSRMKAAKKDFSVEELIELGVMPREVEYVVDEDLRAHLKMDGGSDS